MVSNSAQVMAESRGTVGMGSPLRPWLAAESSCPDPFQKRNREWTSSIWYGRMEPGRLRLSPPVHS